MKEFGSDGAHLALGLPKGTLVIEVQKEGYESYKEVVAVRADESEHFVSVTLPPKNKGKWIMQEEENGVSVDSRS